MFLGEMSAMDLDAEDILIPSATPTVGHGGTTGLVLKIVQERLGHSSIKITIDRYSHVLPGMQEDAVAKVDAAIQAALNKRDTK